MRKMDIKPVCSLTKFNHLAVSLTLSAGKIYSISGSVPTDFFSLRSILDPPKNTRTDILTVNMSC